MPSFLDSLASSMNIPIWLLLIVIVWSLIWKAFALWKSARANHKIWFVLFLLVHTVGILEILYLFLFSKIKLPHARERIKRRK